MPDFTVHPQVEIPAEDIDGTLWEVFAVFAELRLVERAQAAWFETAAAVHEFELFKCRRPLPTDLTDEAMADFVRWYIGNPHVPTRPTTRRTALLRVDRLLTLWRFAANARYVDYLPKITGRPRHYRGENVEPAEWVSKLFDLEEDAA